MLLWELSKNVGLLGYTIIHENLKTVTTQMSIYRWADNQNVHIHTMEHYSDFKKNEILMPATTWQAMKTVWYMK